MSSRRCLRLFLIYYEQMIVLMTSLLLICAATTFAAPLGIVPEENWGEVSNAEEEESLRRGDESLVGRDVLGTPNGNGRAESMTPPDEDDDISSVGRVIDATLPQAKPSSAPLRLRYLCVRRKQLRRSAKSTLTPSIGEARTLAFRCPSARIARTGRRSRVRERTDGRLARRLGLGRGRLSGALSDGSRPRRPQRMLLRQGREPGRDHLLAIGETATCRTGSFALTPRGSLAYRQ